MTYVFDACALIAYVRGEPGDAIVEDILLDPRSECYIHAINACEVFYDFVRTSEVLVASSVIQDLKGSGIIISEDFDSDLWQPAGVLKANVKRISLADAIAITFADRIGATLVTSDHKEFDPLVELDLCEILFIR